MSELTESDIIRIVQREIKSSLNVILSGQSGNPTDDGAGNYAEDIQNMFPGMPGILQRPVAHPYGFASKAPVGTTQVVARQGDHKANRFVLSHRAADRPTDLEVGEAGMYSSTGFRVVCKLDRVEIGKGENLQPLVLGTTLNTFLTNLVQAIMQITHAAPGVPPTNLAVFQQLLTTVLQTNSIIVQSGDGD